VKLDAKPFKDFVTLQRGFDLPAHSRRIGPYPVVASTSISGFHAEYKVEPPGVVTGRSGALGEVQYVTTRYWPLNTALWVKDFKGNLPRYVYYYLQTIDLKRFNSGAGVPTLNRNDLDVLEVRAHSRTHQQHVASILSAYDDLIDNNTRRIAILEEMAKSMYEEWFVRFRFPSPDSAAPKAASEIGALPAGWEVKELNDVVEEILDCRGKTPAKLSGEWASEGLIALSALNVKNGRLVNLDKAKFVGEELYHRWMKTPLRRGDILMTSEAPLGELYLLCADHPYCLSQRLFAIRADARILSPVVLYLALASPQVQSELASRATGATVSGIRQAELRKVCVVVPPPELQRQCVRILSPLLDLKDRLDSINTNLRVTRDLLLTKLISGELDVSLFADSKAAAA